MWLSQSISNENIYSYTTHTMSDFLPENYNAPVKQSNYFKLQDGDNRIRIMSKAITGYQDWDNKKPINTVERKQAIDESRQPKHFRAMIVWNYNTNSFQCWQVTQNSIREQIQNYVDDTDFGNPRGYDLKIKRSWKDLETKYSVTPWKVEPVKKEIQDKFDNLDYELEALYIWEEVIRGTKEEVF